MLLKIKPILKCEEYLAFILIFALPFQGDCSCVASHRVAVGCYALPLAGRKYNNTEYNKNDTITML
jgi:hypothetical protein